MRQIGTISNETDAVRFGDYLLALGMRNSVEESPSNGHWSVWVEDDDHLERARGELEGYLANPSDPRYEQTARQAEAMRAEEQRQAQRRRKLFVDVRTRWQQPRQWSVPVTLGLIIFALVIGVLTREWEINRPIETEPPLVNQLRIAPIKVEGDYITWEGLDAIKHGQVWRLVTPIFLHFGILHILFNLFWLRDLGAMIESRRGSFFMAAIVLVTAVLSNLAQYYFHPGSHTPNPNFGGLSGVVYGLFGYVWLRGRFDPGGGIGVSRDTVIIMLLWLGVCMTGLMGPIANTAHFVGLLIGCSFAAIPHLLRKLVRR